MSQELSPSNNCALVLAPEHELSQTDDADIEFAFQLSLPELLVLPKDRLQAVNVDVRTAVCLGLGAAQRLGQWRARLVSELPNFDIRCLDRLQQYACALMFAHAEYALARKRPADIQALTRVACHQYEIMLNDARALAARGLIQPECIAKLKGQRRRVAKAIGLMGLVLVLRGAWSSIEGKTALTLPELDQAKQLAMQLVHALAQQKKPLEDLAKIAEMRQRAFTLFASAYTRVRNAIKYLSAGSGEVEHIVPTLYPRKRRRKKAKGAATDQAPLVCSRCSSTPANVIDTILQPKACVT